MSQMSNIPISIEILLLVSKLSKFNIQYNHLIIEFHWQCAILRYNEVNFSLSALNNWHSSWFEKPVHNLWMVSVECLSAMHRQIQQLCTNNFLLSNTFSPGILCYICEVTVTMIPTPPMGTPMRVQNVSLSLYATICIKCKAHMSICEWIKLCGK